MLVAAVAQFSGRARISPRLVEVVVVAEGQKMGMAVEAVVSLAMTGMILKETVVLVARKLQKVLVAKQRVISTKVHTARTPSVAEAGVDFMGAARARYPRLCSHQIFDASCVFIRRIILPTLVLSLACPDQTSNKGGGGGSSYVAGLMKATGQTYAGMNGQDYLGGMSGARGAAWASDVGKGGNHGSGGQNGRVIIR